MTDSTSPASGEATAEELPVSKTAYVIVVGIFLLAVIAFAFFLTTLFQDKMEREALAERRLSVAERVHTDPEWNFTGTESNPKVVLKKWKTSSITINDLSARLEGSGFNDIKCTERDTAPEEWFSCKGVIKQTGYTSYVGIFAATNEHGGYDITIVSGDKPE